MAVTRNTAQRVRQLKFERDSYSTPGFYIAKLEEALGVVHKQMQIFPGLLNRLSTIWADESRQSVLSSIEALALETNPLPGGTSKNWGLQPPTRRLSEERQEQLATTLTQLVQKAESLPARDRDRADRAVARISRLLTVERA